MEKDPRRLSDDNLAVLLADLMTTDISVVPVEAPLGVISRLKARWVVFTGDDGDVTGVISRDVAVRAAESADQSVRYLARREYFEVLPADLELGNSGASIGPRTSITSLIVAVENDVPVGVWAENNQYVLLNPPGQTEFEASGTLVARGTDGFRFALLSKSAGHIDTQLGGKTGCEIITRRCKYVEPGQPDQCGALRNVIERYEIIPCDNPRHWSPHNFVR